ncbi:MAG: DUF2956 family protein [Methylococcales bacterium]
MSNKKHQDKPLSFEAQAALAIKDEAMKIAKATQSPEQSKKETQLISQGIAKGIEAYKKQEKSKARERSRNEKKKKIDPVVTNNNDTTNQKMSSHRLSKILKYAGSFISILSIAHFAVIFIPKQTLETNTHWLPIIAISLGIVYLMAAFLVLKIANKLGK